MRSAKQMVEHLKAMGLAQPQRSKCMETFHDAGEAEALEQAERYVTDARNRIANARHAALALFNLAI